jgi:hypothetical protein
MKRSLEALFQELLRNETNRLFGVVNKGYFSVAGGLVEQRYAELTRELDSLDRLESLNRKIRSKARNLWNSYFAGRAFRPIFHVVHRHMDYFCVGTCIFKISSMTLLTNLVKMS